MARDAGDLCFAPISEAAARLKSGEVSPVELTRAMLERISRLDSNYLSYSSVSEDFALGQARSAEAEIAGGRWRGPLHGIPIAVKDLVAVAGLESACGSSFRSGVVSDENATVVDKLIDAGAVILGKTAMTEYALAGYNPAFSAPKNPWNADHWSGVSSSGSAVAAVTRLCFGAVASDTGGSIRMPSFANGAVGLKPTFGLVSKHGCFPLSLSLDHIGPITKCVEDAGILLDSMAGYDARDPHSFYGNVDLKINSLGRGVKGMRIGVDWTYCREGVNPEVFDAVSNALKYFESQGASVADVSVCGFQSACEYWYPLVAIEALNVHKETFPSRSGEYGPTFRSLLEYGQTLTADYVAAGYQAFAQSRQALRAVLKNVDCMICPTDSAPAPTIANFPPDLVMPPEAVESIMAFIAPYNFSGAPTISVPSGFSADGLPLSLQLVAAPGDESVLLAAAYCYEQGHDWKTTMPNGIQ